MALMAMFVIAFGVGCLTGIVVMLSSMNRRTGRSTNALPFRASSSDD